MLFATKLKLSTWSLSKVLPELDRQQHTVLKIQFRAQKIEFEIGHFIAGLFHKIDFLDSTWFFRMVWATQKID